MEGASIAQALQAQGPSWMQSARVRRYAGVHRARCQGGKEDSLRVLLAQRSNGKLRFAPARSKEK